MAQGTEEQIARTHVSAAAEPDGVDADEEGETDGAVAAVEPEAQLDVFEVLGCALQGLLAAEFAFVVCEEAFSVGEGEAAEAVACRRGFEHAVRRNVPPLPAVERGGRQFLVQFYGAGNVEFEVEWLGEFTQHHVENVFVFLVDFQELVPLGEYDCGEQIDGHYGVSGEEKVKQPCDVLVVLDVVGEHGNGVGQRKRGLALGEMVV